MLGDMIDLPLLYTSVIALVIFLIISTEKGLELLEFGRAEALRLPILREYVSVSCIIKAVVAENEQCGGECQQHRTDTLSRFGMYIKDSTLDRECKTGLFKLRTLWTNWILLRKIHQAIQDDRLSSCDETKSPEKIQRFVDTFIVDDTSTAHPAIELPQALRLMKLTTAAYGSSTVNGAAARSNRSSIVSDPVKSDMDMLQRYNSMPTLRKSAVVINRNGYWKYADHILIWNHEKKVSALTIRGTLSIADALADLDVTPVAFCGGIAPHGMVRGVMNVWEQIKDEVMTKRATENYLMCIKGHSLGGGIAMLLTMYLIHQKGFSNIRCHAYGAPPVFAGNDGTIKAVGKYITAFVHQDDVVPFTSPYHLRQLNTSLATIDHARQKLSWFQLMKAVLSTRPSPELTKAFLEQPPLEPVSLIPPLEWPAGRTVWLRKTGGQHYDAIVCDSKRLGLDRGLLLTNTILSDHLTMHYEEALRDLTDRAAEVLGDSTSTCSGKWGNGVGCIMKVSKVE